MAKVQTKDPAPGFETVWAILQEITKSQKEADKRDKERKVEFDRMIKESKAENDKLNKELKKEFNERLGALTNLFGDFTESMVAPALRDKLQDFGFNFQKISRNVSIMDETNKTLMEIDILLENGEKAMLVEIKTKLTIERIKDHIERLEKMRAYANPRGDKRTFLGGAAGVVVTNSAREYALNQGLYLIEPAGKTFNITPPVGKPKEW